MTDQVTIEPAYESATLAVAEIERRSFPSPWEASVLANWLGSVHTRTWQAKSDGVLVGYLLLLLLGDEAEILRLAVLPEFRGQGIGSRLLQAALVSSQSHGLHRIFLEVRKSNAAALALYRKHGFVLGGLRPSYYSDGEDAWILVRSVDKVES